MTHTDCAHHGTCRTPRILLSSSKRSPSTTRAARKTTGEDCARISIHSHLHGWLRQVAAQWQTEFMGLSHLWSWQSGTIWRPTTTYFIGMRHLLRMIRYILHGLEQKKPLADQVRRKQLLGRCFGHYKRPLRSRHTYILTQLVFCMGQQDSGRIVLVTSFYDESGSLPFAMDYG